jgi:cation diffusion facilitator family transporter
MQRPDLRRYAWLSIGAAILTIGLKSTAYQLTGSVGLLSDALESIVNLVAAIMALAMLTVAVRPPDEQHAFGHTKAEYFSSVVEGVLILLAAGSIAWAAWGRLGDPQPIEQPGLGLAVSTVASLVNFVVAQIVLRAGKRYHSITLEADAHHLMTDVWTSVGVLVGIALVALTGWYILDPLIALGVAANIVWTGVQLIGRSGMGLLDSAILPEERATIQVVLDQHEQSTPGVQFHALRTRQAGARRFISFHVLVPGVWTVQAGHTLIETIEEEIRQALPNSTVFTHLEPLEDQRAWDDTGLDRREAPDVPQRAGP